MLNIMNPPADWSTLKKLIWLRGTPINGGEELTVSGAPPITLPNSLGKPLKAWSVDLLPYQNLNGYANPWPAGGGKNKCDESTKSELVSTSGVSITYMGSGVELKAGVTYTFSVSGVLSAPNGIYIRRNADNTSLATAYNANSVTATPTEDTLCYLYVLYNGGQTSDTWANIKAQLEAGSTATAWSPYENICPINGTDKVNLFAESTYDQSATPKAVIDVPTLSANQWDIANVQNGYIDDADGEVKAGAMYKNTGYIEVTPSTSYYVCTEQTSAAWGAWYDADKTYITGVTGYTSNDTPIITSPSNAKYVRLTIRSSATGKPSTFALNYPATVTTYNPYTNTLYGGTYDAVTGVGTITWKQITFDGTQEINNSSFDGSEVMIVRYNIAELAAPGTSQDMSSTIGMCDTLRATTRYYAGGFANWKNDATLKNSYSIIGGGNMIAFGFGDLTINSNQKVNEYLHDNPITVCYELATPVPFATDGHTIPTPRGTATTWATAEDGTVDSMSVTYVGKE